MRKLIMLLVAVIAITISSCSRNVDEVKKIALTFLSERGYTIVSYDGYSFADAGIMGGMVYYQVKDSSNYLYSLAIVKWYDEYHIYNQECLNSLPLKKQ